MGARSAPISTVCHSVTHTTTQPVDRPPANQKRKANLLPSVMNVLAVRADVCVCDRPYGWSVAAGQIADKRCILGHGWVIRAQRRNTTGAGRPEKGECRDWNTWIETSAILRRNQAKPKVCKCVRLCQMRLCKWIWPQKSVLHSFKKKNYISHKAEEKSQEKTNGEVKVWEKSLFMSIVDHQNRHLCSSSSSNRISGSFQLRWASLS